MQRRQRRRLGAWIGLATLAAGAMGVLGTSAASADTATVTVTPNTGLADGGSVTVSVTTTVAIPAPAFIAIQQCGNATTAGAPLASYANADCTGAAGIGPGTIKFIGLSPAFVGEGVTVGVHTVTLVLAQSNIGDNKTKCVSSASLPCIVRVRTVQGSTDYTGTGGFIVDVPISYGTAGTTTTSTTSATTSTTTAGSSTTTTSTTAATSTTSTTTTRSTTSTTAAVVVVNSGTGGGGATGATTAASTSATTATTVASRTLAFTGSGRATWWTFVVGLALLDLGYLALSSTWTERGHRAFPRS
jgi:hypothetical protein